MADIDERLVDKRVHERNIRRGAIDRKDYEKYLKDLPDVADKGEHVAMPTLEPQEDR